MANSFLNLLSLTYQTVPYEPVPIIFFFSKNERFTIKFDYIIHGASNTHPKLYSLDPVGTINTNVIGLNNILKYSTKYKTRRILMMSSVEIYGENKGDTELFDENYLGYINCNTVRAGYPESKRLCEALCQSYISQYGLDIVIGRLSRVYGPTMLKDDSKALAQFIKNALNNLSSYTHLVFTGGNSIRIFFSYLSMLNIDYRVLYNLKIAVIGKGTMLELKKFGINADIMPEYYNSDSLSKCLISSCKDQLNANVLIPRAKKGNNVLSDELKKSAVNYTELPLYNTVHTSSSIHNLEYFDNIIFASSEGVRSFYETNDSNVMDKIKNIICIGEYTANTLKSFGINNYLIPDESSVQGICNLMVNLKGDSNE